MDQITEKISELDVETGLQVSEEVQIVILMDLLHDVGETLLQSGAEISRVEDTIIRIANYYSSHKLELFIVTSGVFISMRVGQAYTYERICHLPKITADLSKLTLVNQLSRHIAEGQYTVVEASAAMKEIMERQSTTFRSLIIATAIGSGSFCYMFGGSIMDCICALVNGVVLSSFQHLIRTKNISLVLEYIFSSSIITFIAVMLHWIGFVENLNLAVIGSIISLIPGVAFINGVRDLADGDYISGGIRLMDAILKIICIATGVGFILRLFNA